MTKTVKADLTPSKVAAYALLEHHLEEGMLRSILDKFDPDILSGANILSERPDGLDAKKGDFAISLMVIQSPYPDEELQTYCQKNLLYSNIWSQVSQTVSHVAVVVRAPAGTPPGKEAVFLTGRIVLALSPKAVLWSAAKSVFSIDDFSQDLQSAQSLQNWPYQTMISVMNAEDSGKKYIHTRGLLDFLGHEISWPAISGNEAEPDTRIHALFEIAKHLLEGNTTLKNGDTVASPASTDTLRAHLRLLPDSTRTLELHNETYSETTSSLPNALGSQKGAPESPQRPRPEHKIRAHILHKADQAPENLTEHRRMEQRSAARSRQDPRDTIDHTLAAIRAAAAEADLSEDQKYPKWMFWKK
jgi:hypothetical protein